MRIIAYYQVSYGIIVPHNLATKIKRIVKPEFSNRLVANKRLLKANKSDKRQKDYRENECTPHGTRIYRVEVTSRYKKYCGPVTVGLRGIGDSLVTS